MREVCEGEDLGGGFKFDQIERYALTKKKLYIFVIVTQRNNQER